ncbi:MAG: hypothetical protein ACXVCP_13145 [Bdellovibrio sp.]
MKCLFLCLFFFVLSGCTVHRSEGRKQFESEGPSKVSTASLFQLKYCKTSNSLEAWFNEEFPSENYELIVSENDFEVWHSTKNSTVEIKAIQKENSKIQSCVYQFANETVWNNYKEQFLREIENNMMTLEQD